MFCPEDVIKCSAAHLGGAAANMSARECLNATHTYIYLQSGRRVISIIDGCFLFEVLWDTGLQPNLMRNRFLRLLLWFDTSALSRLPPSQLKQHSALMDELKIHVRINLTCRREQCTIAHKGACECAFCRTGPKKW